MQETNPGSGIYYWYTKNPDGSSKYIGKTNPGEVTEYHFRQTLRTKLVTVKANEKAVDSFRESLQRRERKLSRDTGKKVTFSKNNISSIRAKVGEHQFNIQFGGDVFFRDDPSQEGRWLAFADASEPIERDGKVFVTFGKDFFEELGSEEQSALNTALKDIFKNRDIQRGNTTLTFRKDIGGQGTLAHGGTFTKLEQ
jgi:hypothetical protein